MSKVTFLNPRTCGIYKDGGVRYKTDQKTGMRTKEIDNELIEHVIAYLAKKTPPGGTKIKLDDIFNRKVLVPTYYDERLNAKFHEMLEANGLKSISIGELLDKKIIMSRGGHGSPGNDQRSGHIPYVKVSDIRGLRVNINPTNLVTASVAKRFWRKKDLSGLQAWDIITPNRASSNIGEFAILLPGEEQIVITKEVFIFRILKEDADIDPFYLLWALSLKSVREQWRRIALMQTNREDCGDRHREILIPMPKSKEWAYQVSKPFRDYFNTVATAKTAFVQGLADTEYEFIANLGATQALVEPAEEQGETDG